MAIGLGVLALSPAVFWTLTPKEFDAALRGRFGPDKSAGGLTHADLAGLMQAFPDEARQEEY